MQKKQNWFGIWAGVVGFYVSRIPPSLNEDWGINHVVSLRHRYWSFYCSRAGGNHFDRPLHLGKIKFYFWCAKNLSNGLLSSSGFATASYCPAEDLFFHVFGVFSLLFWTKADWRQQMNITLRTSTWKIITLIHLKENRKKWKGKMSSVLFLGPFETQTRTNLHGAYLLGDSPCISLKYLLLGLQYF